MKAEHYYTEKPTSRLKLFKLTTNLLGFNVSLYAATGVFNYKRVDRATRVLIKHLKVKHGMKVLDLGCGYGVIGIITAKLGCEVIMSDVNERALMLARKNVKLNNVKARVIKSDLFNNIEGLFDSIITNPPIARGLEFNYKLIDESVNHLKKGGSLQLVARHNKGGKRLKERMIEVYGNAEELCRSGGFRVYYSKKL